MYLHRLTMAAIGPFRAEVDVDFARIGATGLFLLRGPTGSGKSTIIDAVAFALYGKVAGSTTSDSRIVSRVSNGEPVVELTFEVDAGIFRIRRTPSYERPKRRSAGTTVAPASVKLWRLAAPDCASGELISNRVGEADAAVRDILGLSRDQFVQTVILPQGEFSRFLHSSPEERREVLRRLFATDTYDEITAELCDRRKLAIAACAEADSQLDSALTAFVTAAALDAGVAGPIVDAESTSDIDKLIAEVTAELDAATVRSAADCELDANKLAAAELDLKIGRETAAALAKLRSAADELRELEADERLNRDRTNQIALIRALQGLLPVHDGLISARLADWAATASARAALDELPDDARHLTGAQRKALAAELAGEVARLHKSALSEGDLQRHRRQLQQWEIEHETLTRREDRERAEVRAIEGLLVTLRAHAAQLSSVADLLAQRESEQLAATKVCAAATRLPAAQTRLASIANALHQAHAAAVASSEHAATMRRGYIAGIAGVLAGQLTSGVECPVCGSTQHPSPRATTADMITEVDVAAAETHVAELTEALEVFRARYESCRADAESLGIASHGMTPDDATAALEDADVALHEAQGAHLQLPDVHQRLHDASGRLEAVSVDLTATTAQLAASGERIAVGTHTVRELDAELALDRRGHDSIQGRIDELEIFAERLRTVIEAQERATATAMDVATREQQFGELLASADVESESDFVDRCSGAASLARLESEVARHDARLVAVRAALADESVMAVADKPSPDLVALEAAHATAMARRDAGVAVYGLVEDRSRRAADYADAVSKAAGKRDSVHSSTRAVVRMAEVASATSADNLSRMPLSTYVLLDRFRSVVAAANERLNAMSEGRYSLAHHMDLEDRGRKSGLGLRIRDHLTDCERDPKTLSGGETFYVSLALALGLADVVSAEAGGVRLGTLFIDEGFGSLDPETLDAVLTEVSRLRQAGRVVGIVSHIEELTQRIADRIEVEPVGGGVSTIRVVA